MNINDIGAATAVNEGADIPISLLTQSTTKVKVSKIGKAVQFTDEAALSGWGSVANEAARQVVLAINDKVEGLLLQNMATVAAQSKTIAAASTTDGVADDIADALTLFGEDIDGEKVLLIPPALYARLRKTSAWVPNTELGANAIVRGTVGMVHGCQIVVSNRLKSFTNYTYTKTTDVAVSEAKTYYIVNDLGSFEKVESPKTADIGDYYERTSATASAAFIVKPGALAIVMKRDTLVEVDRDIIDETNVIKASKLFAPYVYNANKVIKLPIATA